MNGLFEVATAIQGFCRDRAWHFCFIGGLAVQRWGEPRQTRDVDLTLLTGFGAERPYVDELLAAFDARLPDAAAFAMQNRVLLLRSPSGVGIDIALGALPFEERAVSRASDWIIDADAVLFTCSAEDLIVYKAFAGRPQDWADVEMVVARRGGGLDVEAILEEALPLLELKEAAADRERLESLLRR